MHPFSEDIQRLGLAPGTPQGENARRALEGAYRSGQRDAVVYIDTARNVLQAMGEVTSHLVTELARLSLSGLPLQHQQIERLGAELHQRLDLVILLAERLPEAPAEGEVAS